MEWNDEDFDNVFNNTTREFVIFFLLLIVLQFLSYCLISLYKKRRSIYHSDHDDAIVYRISFWTCNFSLSISIGAAFLLPISIMSNEILLVYPNSYYIRWLKISLIQGFWNVEFLFSNLAIFILLPFAYFFSESQGFSNSYKGIKGRIYETFCVLILVGMLISSLIYIVCAIFGYNKDSFILFFHSWSDFFPFLYSCLSFLGVLMLLVCTPVGFANIFTVVGRLVVNKKIVKELQTDMLKLEKANSVQKLLKLENYYVLQNSQKLAKDNEALYSLEDFPKGARIRRSIIYPLAMLFLMALTVTSALMVAQNMLLLCFGIKALPMYSQNFSLGINSLSALGPFGALLEIILILYLWCSSIIGLYALPLFHRIKPKFHQTPMTHMMGNCVVLLILSSALPVLARTIGITNFDLLGNFGQIYWLENMYIVLFYNVVFAVSTLVCLGTKVTATVRQELMSLFRCFARSPFTQQISLVVKEPSEVVKFD